MAKNATILVRFNGREDMRIEDVNGLRVQKIAHEQWDKHEDVKTVVTCLGDSGLLSSWGLVARDGTWIQPEMNDMRDLGLDEGVQDDIYGDEDDGDEDDEDEDDGDEDDVYDDDVDEDDDEDEDDDFFGDDDEDDWAEDDE